MSTRELLVYFVITFIAAFLAISLAMSLQPQFMGAPSTTVPSQTGGQPTLPGHETTTPGATVPPAGTGTTNP